jgi:primosomal protein N' (replication factor Y)
MTEPLYARIAVNIPQISGVFDYHVPEEWAGRITAGSLVVVPFGRQTAQGVVLEMRPNAEVQATKSLLALLDAQPVLSSRQIELCRWMAEATFTPLPACIDLFLPPGLSQQADTLFSPASPGAGVASPTEQRILHLLQQRGPLRGRQLDNALPHANGRQVARAMVKRGLLFSQPVLPPVSVHPRLVRTAQLVSPLNEALARAAELSRNPSTLSRRQAALRYLHTEAVPTNVAWVYASSKCTLADLKLLAEEGLLILGETEVFRDPLHDLEFVPEGKPVLTSEQAHTWEHISEGLVASQKGANLKPYLLHGVTGSGKTELYLLAAGQVLAAGRQVIVLVPEIALVHSRLSDGERYDTWRRMRAGSLPIVIGPRSALFSPLPDVGLIVVDECHDASYNQEDFPPFYDAVTVAEHMAAAGKALLLLGSATPDVTMLQRANQQGWERLELPLRIMAHRQVISREMERLGRPMDLAPGGPDGAVLPLPAIKVVDMRQERKAGNSSILSRELRSALDDVLVHKQQAILFLNRRGSSTYVFCRSCGYVLRCPHCYFPLTYHEETGGLLCHLCNYRRQLPEKCPACGSDQIRRYGTGTEGLEKTVHEFFPQASLLRWDAETTRTKGAHEIILSHFLNHRADILIGTQMLAKGLDIPLVTLVGVILADIGLNLPDFRAGERTFQLLTQVTGRAGRSPLGGQAIIQTFQPDHYVIQAAARHDFPGFFHQELEYRRRIGYPPFTRLVKLEFREVKPADAERKARQAAALLQAAIEEGGFVATSLIGPVPCYYARRAGLYRWQIVLRGPDPTQVVRKMKRIDARVIVDPDDLL